MTQTKAGRDPEGALKDIAAQAQPDAELLKALRNAQEVIHLQFCKADKECWKECQEASAAIAQTEKGAAG